MKEKCAVCQDQYHLENEVKRYNYDADGYPTIPNGTDVWLCDICWNYKLTEVICD